MDRNELIEKAAWEIVKGRNGANCLPWGRLPEVHQRPYRGDVNAVLAAIESAGLCIVPVGPTKEMMDSAGGEFVNLERCDDQSYCPSDVYSAMIEAGKV